MEFSRTDFRGSKIPENQSKDYPEGPASMKLSNSPNSQVNATQNSNAMLQNESDAYCQASVCFNHLIEVPWGSQSGDDGRDFDLRLMPAASQIEAPCLCSTSASEAQSTILLPHPSINLESMSPQNQMWNRKRAGKGPRCKA